MPTVRRETSYSGTQILAVEFEDGWEAVMYGGLSLQLEKWSDANLIERAVRYRVAQDFDRKVVSEIRSGG